MLYLKRWYFDHPEARPFHLAHAAYFDPEILGIAFSEPPVDPRYTLLRVKSPSDQLGPKPGWYALSVNRLHDWTNQYSYFLNFHPVATAGYSIYIYHITIDDANGVRRELGLAELPSDWRPTEESAGS